MLFRSDLSPANLRAHRLDPRGRALRADVRLRKHPQARRTLRSPAESPQAARARHCHYVLKFPNKDFINIQCYKYSKHMNTPDHLKVMIAPKKFNDHYLEAKK